MTGRLTDAVFEDLVRERADPTSSAYGVVPQLASMVGLSEALAAAANPLLRATITVVESRRVLVHRVWVGGDAVAYLAAADETDRSLIVTTPEFLSSGLARLVGLGPRTTEGVPALEPLEPGDLDKLLGDNVGDRDETLARCGATAVWTMLIEAENSELFSLVLDRPDGYVEMTSLDGNVVSQALSPTDLWRAFSAVLLQIEPPAESQPPPLGGHG